ncbi:MAG TPA: TolC family protein [Bacteroidales bacterium]|nr:TolC family protein [Bacteroidales bacterium]HPT01266.1 TolC family protein [Bacteroidales bacterium]
MKKIFLLLCTLLASATGFPQQVWTLEKCIEYALSNNIQVKQQILQIDAGKSSLLQSRLDLLPSLNAGAQHGYNFGQTVDRYTNDFATKSVQTDNFYIGSELTLWDGFKKVNQVRQNQADLEAARYETDKFMDDISLNIATAYLQILYYQEVLRTAQNQAGISQQQTDRLVKMVDAGASAQGDLYNIQAQLASAKVSVVDARNNLDLAYLTLAQMLDLPSAEGFEIEIPNLDIGNQPALVANPDQVYGYALETQPVIKSAELRVKSSEYGLMLARGAQSPQLSMSASLATGYSGAATMLGDSIKKTEPIGFTMINGVPDEIVYTSYTSFKSKDKPFGDQINDNINRSLSFTLSVPIFNGWATRSAISRARINVENSKYTLDLRKLELRKTIQQAYADARGALDKYNASLAGVEAAHESFRFAEQKFNVGMMNSVDFNNARKEYEQADSDMLRAKYEFIFKTTVLDFYMGKPITLNRK